MSNIPSVGNQVAINPLTNFAADPGAPSLSPEMLLAYCSSRLESLDTNIKQYFDEQQKKNAAMKACSALQAVLGRESSHWGSKELLKPENAAHLQNHANMGNDIIAVWRSTDDPEVKKACADAFKNFTGLDIEEMTNPEKASARGHFGVTAEDIKAAAHADKIPAADNTQWASVIEGVKGVQQGLSKGSEMNMIQLQSLVSQRQLAVQLTTQLMQTLHESAKQTVGNIRA